MRQDCECGRSAPAFERRERDERGAITTWLAWYCRCGAQGLREIQTLYVEFDQLSHRPD